MAGANLPAKKYKHTTPTQLRLVFQFDEGEQEGYIDLAQALSAVNRRFYRQGVYYYINSMEVEALADGYVEVSVAPDTWTLQQAWKRGFNIFQKMNSMVDTPRPAYHDFKVFLDAAHRNFINSGNNNKVPVGTGDLGNLDTFDTDEWNYSQFVSFRDRTVSNTQMIHETNPNQFNAHLVGFHDGTGPDLWDSVGLIKSYKESRPLPDNGTGQPTLPQGNDDDPLLRMFEGSEVHALEEIAEHLDIRNDIVPYDRDTYSGEKQNHLVPLERLYTSGNPAGRTHKVSGACIPMGLMRIQSDGLMAGYRLILNVSSGTYNGVYGERV